jgi:hypothetical protein
MEVVVVVVFMSSREVAMDCQEDNQDCDYDQMEIEKNLKDPSSNLPRRCFD